MPTWPATLNVSPQAMNMVLRGLEDRGLVTRPASVSSGRSLPAQLTREGEELLTRTDAGVRAAERKLMANLSAEQRRDSSESWSPSAPTEPRRRPEATNGPYVNPATYQPLTPVR